MLHAGTSICSPQLVDTVNKGTRRCFCMYGDWPFALFLAKVPLRKEPDKRETASDRPSIQSKVRPTTGRPVLLRRKSYIVLRAGIYAPFKARTKVAAFGRHQKRGDAAFGRATSFVVSFACALDGASILALSTIYYLRLSKTGRTVLGRTFDWMNGRSDAVSRLSGSFLKGTLAENKANSQSPYEVLELSMSTAVNVIIIVHRTQESVG